MKIAQIAPLQESVPPQGYGGTERVVSWLTEELVRKGHDVTLFATGDSIVANNLVLNLYRHVNAPEARLYLSRPRHDAALHVQLSLTLLDSSVPDTAARARALPPGDAGPSNRRKPDLSGP